MISPEDSRIPFSLFVEGVHELGPDEYARLRRVLGNHSLTVYEIYDKRSTAALIDSDSDPYRIENPDGPDQIPVLRLADDESLKRAARKHGFSEHAVTQALNTFRREGKFLENIPGSIRERTEWAGKAPLFFYPVSYLASDVVPASTVEKSDTEGAVSTSYSRPKVSRSTMAVHGLKKTASLDLGALEVLLDTPTFRKDYGIGEKGFNFFKAVVTENIIDYPDAEDIAG
jgi:hypothetical protein